MKTFLITGATRGLGLAIARQLAQQSSNQIVMAVRDTNKGAELAHEIGPNVQVVNLDLCSLDGIQQFVNSWSQSLAGLVNNAGVQTVNGTRFTPDGHEETIAVNHLGSLALTQGLLPYLINGRVLFIGSGTHDPSHPTATWYGFRGAQYTSIAKLLAGDGASTDERQLGLDRYATSKFLNTITAVELARRYREIQFFVLDPGVMAGTGLARTHSATRQFLWATLLPVLNLFLPDSSTPSRSARTAAWILTAISLAGESGNIYSYDKSPAKHVWEELVMDPILGCQIVDETLDVISKHCPQDI